jgi:hypothetical protein
MLCLAMMYTLLFLVEKFGQENETFKKMMMKKKKKKVTLQYRIGFANGWWYNVKEGNNDMIRTDEQKQMVSWFQWMFCKGATKENIYYSTLVEIDSFLLLETVYQVFEIPTDIDTILSNVWEHLQTSQGTARKLDSLKLILKATRFSLDRLKGHY